MPNPPDGDNAPDFSHIQLPAPATDDHLMQNSQVEVVQTSHIKDNEPQNACVIETSHIQPGRKSATTTPKKIDACCDAPKEIDVCCDEMNNREQSFLGYGRAQTNFHPTSQTMMDEMKLQ